MEAVFNDIRLIGFALSPLAVFLFACEMCSLEDMLRWDMIGEKASDALTAFYGLKIPATILLPLAHPVFGTAAVAAADALSVLAIAKAQLEHAKRARHAKTDKEEGHDL